MNRILIWFSCGITSAVATKLTLDFYKNSTIPIEIVYCDTSSEHPDNRRFLLACQDWLAYPITILHSKKYSDIWDVYEKTHYIAGIRGASCSLELKKRVRQDFENLKNDIQIFGFDSSEQKRVEKFKKNNPEVTLVTPLLEKDISKLDCIKVIQKAGIDIPYMYKLGYKNNNCIGCPKGAKGYWNKIRKDFPETFKRMASVEKKIGAKLNIMGVGHCKTKRISLDELPPNLGNYKSELPISCGLLCN